MPFPHWSWHSLWIINEILTALLLIRSSHGFHVVTACLKSFHNKSYKLKAFCEIILWHNVYPIFTETEQPICMRILWSNITCWFAFKATLSCLSFTVRKQYFVVSWVFCSPDIKWWCAKCSLSWVFWVNSIKCSLRFLGNKLNC